MNTVALLTGRGGNTLKDKNILPVLGKPLLAYPALEAKKSKHVNHFFVSSEDDKILEAAKECGYSPIIRPKELSLPTAQHKDVLTHALKILSEQNIQPDFLVVLLANSATVKSIWIDDCIELLLKNPHATAAVPVLQDSDHHPLRAKRMNSNGYLQSFFEKEKTVVSSNRQSLEPSYFLCHNFWVLNVRSSIVQDDGEGPWSFMGKNVLPYVVEHSFDVHNEDDLLYTERWIKKNLSL